MLYKEVKFFDKVSLIFLIQYPSLLTETSADNTVSKPDKPIDPKHCNKSPTKIIKSGQQGLTRIDADMIWCMRIIKPKLNQSSALLRSQSLCRSQREEPKELPMAESFL